MGSKDRYLKKCPKPCKTIRSKETWTKYTPQEIHFLSYKIIGKPKKLKIWPRPLFRPRTDHSCHQKSNSSRETVSLKACTALRNMEDPVTCTLLHAVYTVQAPIDLRGGGGEGRAEHFDGGKTN
jgi:hypothetical protein